MTSIKAVLFDAVGTLIYPAPPAAEVYHAVGQQLGSTLSVEEIASRFAAAFSRFCPPATSCGVTNHELERQRWQAIVAEVFHDQGDARAEAFEPLWNHFAQPGHWRLFDDVAATWRFLAQRGLLLGIASNFDDRLAGLCRGLPPLDECSHLFWSSGVGHSKPCREFFADVERELGLKPHEILLVGDDYENDFLGATAAGWQAVLLNRNGEHEAGSLRIRSLAELPHGVPLASRQ